MASTRGTYELEHEERSRRSREAHQGLSKLTRAYLRYTERARKNIIVDIDSLEKALQGAKARIYKHVAEDNIVKLVENDEVLRRAIKIIETDPILSSRTLRGKVALAMLLLKRFNIRNYSLREISRLTALSLPHIRRLEKVLDSRLARIAKLMRSVIAT